MERRNSILLLTEELRTILKKPLGLLIEGTVKDTTKKALKLLEGKTPPLIIGVGDICVRSLLQKGVKLNISIIDGKTLRTSEEFVDVSAEISVELENPQGYLVPKAWDIVEKAMKSKKRTEIFIHGEEDLFTLPSVLLAPLKSIVFYGQPPLPDFNMNAGLVMITVTNEKKAEFIDYLNAMDIVDEIRL